MQRDGAVRFIHWAVPNADPQGSHVTVDTPIGVDTWYHVAAVWDGSTSHLYVNGVHREHVDGTSASGWNSGSEIGRAWTQPAYYWQGLIEDVRLYRRVLSASEIASQFTANPKSKPQKAEPEPSGDPLISASVDQHIEFQLLADQAAANHPCSDAEFHRRVMLDLAGRVPTLDETVAFLQDEKPSKRHALIDSLLSGREMPIYWSQVLSNWLMTGKARRDEQFVNYLRRGLSQKKSWDAFARDMLLARPPRADRHASAFLSHRASQIKDGTIGRDIGRAFFGVNLRCAQCHDHPSVDEWKQEHAFGLAAFYVRSIPGAYQDGDNVTIPVVGEAASGELQFTPVGGTLQAARLMFLDGTIVAEPPAPQQVEAVDDKPAALPKDAPPPIPEFSRRQAFVKIALDPDKPYLQRALVNRVWKQLMGRGLVEPLDMIHDGNAASHPELFRLLSDDFADHGFDLRRLIGVIMKTEAYARSSRGTGQDASLYTAAIMKPLDEYQLALSLPLAAGFYTQQLQRNPSKTFADLRPVKPWTRIIEQFQSESGEFEPGHALFLLNSEYFQEELLGKSPLADSLATITDPGQLSRQAYLTVLSRLPSAAETNRLADYLAGRGETPTAVVCQEIVWALFTSAEFRFNH